MYTDPAGTGHNIVWRHPWLAGVMSELVSLTKPQGTITSLDLKLATFVLQEATLLKVSPKACMDPPHSGSDNTPTVSWSTHKSSTINLVVADLIRIHALNSRKFFMNPYVFTTRSKKTACQIMLPACFIYLTPHFSSTCMLSTPSHMVRGRSPSRCWKCFSA